ncbi:hypothetical protein K450DRAFT_276438 [Umbelopsis ramanniana AG]|uniref:Uncharacterized protein n=1 Tax=Umbelopsis ramanniana AG TaxID=1314678 RepID=A0AAD5HJI2_UMBRA|nr:uncharacterized protein K450DRAFT_276438 [Umbelopsis ramanniana AG]KAI8584776.1 hypothetical protein K450DRAFT_276438 [Umbelopsis ramanniana AG]
MQLLDITVAKIAAVISAGVTILQFTFGLALVIILVYLMQNSNTPTTWSVFVRTLHYSSWPTILSTDVSNSDHVGKRVKLISTLSTITMILATIAGVITPLGLLPTFRQDAAKVDLYPVSDNKMLYIPLTPRNNYSETRYCSGYLNQAAPCPGQTLVNVTGLGALQTDLHIPQNITTTFSSTPYSSPFDLQYRRYVLSNSDYNVSGLFPRPQLSIANSVVLRNQLYATSGLIVDTTDTPGIGIGGIQVPILPYGATWNQDIMWIEPVTSCVDLNFTLNYQLNAAATISSVFASPSSNISIVDNGGFSNLNVTYPVIGRNGQEVTMEDRANKLAFLSLAYIMSQWNISKENTALGKRWPITQTGNIALHQVGFYPSSDIAALFPINSSLTVKDDASDFSSLCAGFFGADDANITNTAVKCAMLVGGPSRTDGGDPRIDEAFSSWQQPVYACASTVRAKMQTLTIAFNSSVTSGNFDLSDLTLTRQDSSTVMTWGVEKTGLPISGVDPYWGPVADQYQNDPSLFTLQSNTLYLPAGSGSTSISGLGKTCHAMALPQYALSASMEADESGKLYDYSGSSNVALRQLWTNLSLSASTASRMSNLIWTDVMANNLYSNFSAQSTVVMQNIPSVGYNLLYAIPAFLYLFVWLAMVISVIILFVTKRISIHAIRQALYQTSLGRIVINVATSSPNFNMRTRDWIETGNNTVIGLNVTAKLQGDHMRFQMVPETSNLWQVLNPRVPTNLKSESRTRISEPLELYPTEYKR